MLVGDHRVEAAVHRHDLAAVAAGVDDAPVLARTRVLRLLPLLLLALLLLAIQAGLPRRDDPAGVLPALAEPQAHDVTGRVKSVRTTSPRPDQAFVNPSKSMP